MRANTSITARPRRLGRVLAVVAFLAVAAPAPAVLSGTGACAATPRHAALVIDTGSRELAYCVAIPGTIDGIESDPLGEPPVRPAIRPRIRRGGRMPAGRSGRHGRRLLRGLPSVLGLLARRSCRRLVVVERRCRFGLREPRRRRRMELGHRTGRLVSPPAAGDTAGRRVRATFDPSPRRRRRWRRWHG